MELYQWFDCCDVVIASPLFLVPLGSLLTVFGFLTGTAAAMGTSDVFLLLGFCPYLTIAVAVARTAAPPDDATLDDGFDVVALAHGLCFFNGGTNARR